MSAVDPRGRAVAAGLLMVARAVYAFSWYDVGGILPLIGAHYGIGTVPLGVVLASFLIGAAVFQLPAGYAAMRWGSRATSIMALGLMGVFAVASAASPSWQMLALFRFGVGAGAAFFFAPALGLLTSYYPSGERGFVIGSYNAAFSVGSGIGLFGSAFLGPTFGWAVPLALGGVLLLAVAGVAVLLLPTPPADAPVASRDLARTARPVYRSVPLWAVALGGAGLWGAFYIGAQYFVNFAHAVHPAWSLALAAAVPTVMIALEIPGGPIGGWLGERSREMRRPLAGWGVVAGLVLAVVPLLSLVGAFGAFAVLGFADGASFALMYLLPTYLPEVEGRVLALALALVNFVQILLGSALALGFALVAVTWGYTAAWGFAGVSAVAFLPFLAWARPTEGKQRRKPASAGPAVL